MVLTQVNYYEKLQFMLFIIIMANYLRFSNTVPKQLEVFIRSSRVKFFHLSLHSMKLKEHPIFFISKRDNIAKDINHKGHIWECI